MKKELLTAGSSHYKHFKIQPLEYIQANNMGFSAGNVVKYVSRYKFSGTPRSDLEKALHYLQILIDECPPDSTTETDRRTQNHVPATD